MKLPYISILLRCSGFVMCWVNVVYERYSMSSAFCISFHCRRYESKCPTQSKGFSPLDLLLERKKKAAAECARQLQCLTSLETKHHDNNPLYSSPVCSTFHHSPVRHADTRRPVPISPPHATLIPTELLQLPHLDLLLALLQRLLAGPPGSLPVRGRHGDEDALLANRDDAQSVDQTDGRQRVFFLRVAGDGEHGLERKGWVGGVF